MRCRLVVAFAVLLCGATRAQVASAAPINVTAAGTVQFSSTEYSVTEGEIVTITVTRTGGADGAASVNWLAQTTGTASSMDLVQMVGTLEWADGDASPKTFTVETREDAESEADETFGVFLTNPTGTTIGSPAFATVTIIDDEPETAGTLRLSNTTYTASESAGSVTITVERTIGSAGAVSVNYSTTAGSATADDFTPTAGTLNWADGDAAPKSFVVPIVDDTLVEENETFSVQLSSPTGGATLGFPSSATVTITSDDVPPPGGSLQFSSSTYTASEGAGSVTITVTRTGGSTGAASVDYTTTAGTATASDFTATSGTLTWADGDTAPKTFLVPITDNAEVEGNETFTVQLSSPSGAILGLITSATVTITDDEPTTVQFSSSTYSVTEGETVTITVTRSGPGGPASVNWLAQTTGTASSTDLVQMAGTLEWANGDASPKTFTVETREDAESEADETFGVFLTNPTGTTIGSPAFATVTIVDDESALSAGTLQFSSGTYTASEEDGVVTITVTRIGGSEGAAAVNYTTSAGTAGAADFAPTSGTLTWADGDMAPKSFTVLIATDASDEANETFTVTLSDATGAALGTPASAVVTITDSALAAAAIPTLSTMVLMMLGVALAAVAAFKLRI